MPSQRTIDDHATLHQQRGTGVDSQAGNAALTKGRKDDQGKASFFLLPFDALAAIHKVLIFGAIKYAARNWEHGMDWSRPWEACIRHLEAWMRREKGDPESGMSHLWHAGCCILFLIAFELRRVGNDNRPEAPPMSQEDKDQSWAKAAA